MTEPTTKAPPLPTPDPMFSAEEVARIIEFHGTPVAAQVLREVLGVLGRTAEWAARKQPKNRPEWLQKWNPPHLRMLAELCATYAPEAGARTSPLGTDPDLFPDATDPEAARAEVEAHRVQVVAEQRAARAAAEGNGGAAAMMERQPLSDAEHTLIEQLGAEPVYPWHRPDPVADDEGEASSLPTFHRPDPVPDEPSPANADEARAAQGGDAPF